MKKQNEEIENTLLEIEAINVWCNLSDNSEEFVEWYKSQSSKLKQQEEEIERLRKELKLYKGFVV